ncbi:hypothetical protein [Burkholderia multivorans]|uniref:hypothetical protein n=1 Tax=Burkholderia multivorans TaxID=87883 RepID=UPI0021C21185|nr:hypothetical protein [Burkholderia multivorans]
MDERESKSEVDEFADFCQAVARNLRAQNPDIKSVDVFSSIAFSLWREKVMPVRNGVIEECASYLDRKWDSAAELLRSLKTTPTAASREEGNG